MSYAKISFTPLANLLSFVLTFGDPSRGASVMYDLNGVMRSRMASPGLDLARARRAERQSSTARRALRWSRPVFLLTLTVVAGGCATMGCALSEHHTLHSAPHLRREFHEIRPVAKGSGLEKSPGSCGAPLLHWVCFK